jgi:hypothetical protein
MAAVRWIVDVLMEEEQDPAAIVEQDDPGDSPANHGMIDGTSKDLA